MSVYFVLISFVLIIGIFVKEGKKKNNIIFLILLLIQFFRNNTVGTDIKVYLGIFNTIIKDTNILFKLNMEKGYLILNKILGIINTNETFFLCSIAIIILYPIKKVLEKESKIIWLSYYLYITLNFYLFSMSGLRQAIAISILLLSLEYIKKREIIKFLIICLLAMSFHKTAIVFIVLYIIYPIEINFYSYILLLIISVCGFLFFQKSLNIIFQIFPIYEERYGGIKLVSGEGFKMFLIYFISLTGFLVLKKFKIRKDEKIYYQMIFLTVILQVLATKIAIVSRLIMYFWIGIIILIPNILSTSKNKKLLFPVIITLGFMYYIFILKKNPQGVVPYVFYFK